MCRFWVHPSNWRVVLNSTHLLVGLGFFSKYECWVTDLIMPIYHFILFGWPPAFLYHKVSYLFMKEGSLFVLFCLYLWHPPNQDASDSVLGLFGKLSTRTGASAWFHDIGTCGAKVIEYWMISSLKIKLN